MFRYRLPTLLILLAAAPLILPDVSLGDAYLASVFGVSAIMVGAFLIWACHWQAKQATGVAARPDKT